MLEFDWSQKYRPQTIKEIILPKNIKSIFEGIVKSGTIPTMMLAGSCGLGKTTAALALVNELDYDYLFLNSSLHGNIDTLRNLISEYASSVSFDGKRKIVILDEADNLTHATQLALRAFIEEFSINCAFIFTCNYPNRLIEGLFSRSGLIEFSIPKNETKDIMKQYIMKSIEILQKEKKEFEPEAVALFVKELFPDFRKILNELQKYSNSGKIDLGIISVIRNDDVINLIKILKIKNFQEIKKWVFEHQDIEINKLISSIYKLADNYVENNSLPDLILIMANYDYKNAFVVNKQINIEAMLYEVMRNVKFK